MAESERGGRSATGSATLRGAVAALLVVPLVVVLGLGAADVASTPAAMPDTTLVGTSTTTTTTTSAEKAAPKQAAGSNRALFFGDSYFIGGGYTDKRHSLAFLASRRLGYTPRITGGGGTGFTAANTAYGLPPYLGQIADGALRSRNPEWVIIEGGANDRGAARQLIRKNARKVLRIALHKHPRAHVVLMGPVDTDVQHDDTRPIVRALRRAARVEGVPFLNAQDWLAGHYDLIGADYVHPTPEGHRLLGRTLARALRARGA